MNKILECVYAYICQNNYSGSCGSGDKLYNLTKGIGQIDVDLLSSAVQDIGRKGLSNIDGNSGKKLYKDSGIYPNYDISSFSYYPKNGDYGKFNNRYNALCCASLRKKVKDRSIRGGKELTHIILFDNIPDDFYAIDMIGSSHFKKFNDIDFDVSQSGDDYICEKVPEEMPIIDFEDTFTSNQLKSDNIFTTRRSNKEYIAEIFHALITSKRQNKPLYIVYEPENYEMICNYLKITLKLMPSSLANKFSFATWVGNNNVNFDICCIPTTDEKYISSLNGNVIRVTGYDTMYLEDEKGSFAHFLSTCEEQEFKDWLEARKRYFPFIKDISDMDKIALLYDNRLDRKISSSYIDTEELVHSFNNTIHVVSEQYKLITRIEDELDRQLNGISNRLDAILGVIDELHFESIEDYILTPIFELFTTYKNNGELVQKTFEWIKKVLFGIGGECREKHFEIVSLCFQSIRAKLGDNYAAFISYLGKDWVALSANFFDAYLSSTIHLENSSSVILSILSCLFQNLSNKRNFNPDMREDLVTMYLQNNSDQFDKIIDCIFSSSRQHYHEELSYIFEILLKNIKTSDVDVRMKYLGEYFYQINITNEAIDYIRNRFLTTVEPEDVNLIRAMFTVLLKYYFKIPYNPNFENIYKSFEAAKKLIGDSTKASLKTEVYKYWNDNIVNPNYQKAIASIDYERISDNDIAKYQNALLYLDSHEIKKLNVISNDFIDAIKKFLDGYTIYKNQKEAEKELVGERIDFVAKEISLLDNKSILKILKKNLGKKAISSKLKKEKINKVKKNRRVSDFAIMETKEFLSNPATRENHTKLCEEVRKSRIDGYKDYRIMGRDAINNFIGSSIFTAIMTIIAAILSYLIYKMISDSYFRSIYFVFVGITAIFSEIIYWSNFKNRRFKNILLMSIWQIILVLLATLGIYALIRYLFILIGF